MPPSESQAVFIRETEKLLVAVLNNPSLLSNLSPFTAPLEQTLGEIKVLSARQEELKADKQKTTQDLRAAYDRAGDQARQVRAAVKAWVGPRSEKLVQFQVAPLRRRSRKKPDPFEEGSSPRPAQGASPETP